MQGSSACPRLHAGNQRPGRRARHKGPVEEGLKRAPEVPVDAGADCVYPISCLTASGDTGGNVALGPDEYPVWAGKERAR
jgi:hypothetical protein